MSGIGTIFFLFQKTAGDESGPSRRRFGGGSVGAGGEGETHSREYRLQQTEDMACFTNALLMLYSCFTHALHIAEEYRLQQAEDMVCFTHDIYKYRRPLELDT